MIGERAWFLTLILCALTVTAAIGQETSPGSALSDDVTLCVKMSGHTQAVEYNPAKYPFNLSNSAKVAGADLSAAVGGELSGDAFTKAFKEIFNKAPESGATIPTVSGMLKGERTGDSVELSGNITVKWSVNDNKGQKQMSADLKGRMDIADGKVSTFSLTGENVKVDGSWNWGGGAMALKGEGTLAIALPECER